ncbi:MAG: apolipoprotein N-acyltransferase [Chthoniobacter sp.]|jgi:apolipoprotein N-acyltransferase|nr:apolipoprotein N-acyltransferase [Chthoniobacter sp.]
MTSGALGDGPSDRGDGLAAVHRLWPWGAAALSGGLLTLCYPRFDQGWLVWIALTPLICATWFRPAGWHPKPGGWRRVWRALGPGYLAGFIFFLSTFHWLGSLANLFHNPLLLSLPVLLAFYFGVYLAAWTWFLEAVLARDATARAFQSSSRNLAIGAAGASAWVALEWVRGWLFGGFGWNGLGVALHRDLAMIQIADVTGVWGLSWLVTFVNLMAVIVTRRIVGELGPVFLKRIRWEFSLSVALVVLVFSYGVRTLIKNDPGPTAPLRVAALQPNIPQTDKFDPNAEEKVLETLGRLTTLATLGKPAPQLVIWPEAATPRAMFADETILRFVLDQAKQGDFGLLTGTLDFDPALDEDYNIVALLTERGERQQLYRKVHLVPFGEYLPLRPIFAPLAGEMVPGDFTPGTEYTVLSLSDPPIKFAALICFEDTVGDLTRRFVLGGAQLLVNVTNDGWFADSPAAEQHLANAIFRAVETRRPLMRCGNTGLTGSIDPFGRTIRLDAKQQAVHAWNVIPFLKPFQQGFVAGQLEVPIENRLTFYARHGDWVPHLSALIALLAIVRAFLPGRFLRKG